MVGRLNNETLTNQMVDYLMGESDDNPKDPIYTLKLYKALGSPDQMIKIALHISNSEQESGNYKNAHQVLFEIYKTLKEDGQLIPYEFAEKLYVLHCYILAKKIIKAGDHLLASKLLVKVCQHISLFQKHAVPILTTTVVECSKSGLKVQAYEWATVLIRAEYRSGINEKYKKKIEDIARKPQKSEDSQEKSTPCPFCKNMIGEFDLNCNSCKNRIPFCITSGKHMILNEWGKCPHCNLPMIVEECKKVLDIEPTCPMCDHELHSNAISRVI